MSPSPRVPIVAPKGKGAAFWRNRIVGTGSESPDQLLANPKNWRLHPGHQQAALRGVLEEVGWVADVLVNRRTGMVVDGHLRVLLALKHHQRSVPVRYVDLSEAEEAKVLATFDTISAVAGADPEKLLELLAQITTGDVGVQGLLDDLVKQHDLAGLPKDAPEPKLDQAEALLKKWKVKPGQLWAIGRHRLLCGDCTDKAQVDRLLEGRRPALLVTDPPYGVEYQPEWRGVVGTLNPRKLGHVTNDDRVDWSEVYPLFGAPVLYVWHAGVYGGPVQVGLERVGYKIIAQIIWAKDRFAVSRGDYHWKHEPAWFAAAKDSEPCLYAVKAGASHQWRGGRKQSTLWEIPAREDSGHGHSTQKPLECMERPILNHTVTGQVVADPFVGSGTTIVAGERTGRVVVAMDLEPRYCAVTLERMSEMGLAPEVLS